MTEIKLLATRFGHIVNLRVSKKVSSLGGVWLYCIFIAYQNT